MDRDNENEAARRRTPEDDRSDGWVPVDAKAAGDKVIRPRKPSRQAIEAGILRAPTPQLPPMKVSSAVLNRRVPSYPAWEKPPSPYLFPQLRGREHHRPLRPLLFAAIGVAAVLIAVVIVPMLLGRGGGGVSAASASTSPSAGSTQSTFPSGQSPRATPSATPTPAGPTVLISYQQYKVVAGDSVAKIAAKFHLQRWELLLANPQISDPNVLKIGSVLNIPQPGQLTPPPTSPPATPTDS